MAECSTDSKRSALIGRSETESVDFVGLHRLCGVRVVARARVAFLHNMHSGTASGYGTLFSSSPRRHRCKGGNIITDQWPFTSNLKNLLFLGVEELVRWFSSQFQETKQFSRFEQNGHRSHDLYITGPGLEGENTQHNARVGEISCSRNFCPVCKHWRCRRRGAERSPPLGPSRRRRRSAGA